MYLRSHAAYVFEGIAPPLNAGPAWDQQMPTLISQALSHADRCEYGPARFDAFDDTVAHTVADLQTFVSNPNNDADVVHRAQAFQASIRATDCHGCKQAPHCSGRSALDADHVRDFGACIEPYRSMVLWLGQAVTDVLTQTTGQDYPSTLVEIDFESPTERRGTFDRYSVAAAHKPGINPPTIRLSFKQESVDWSAVCHSFYIIAHELMCHAAQEILNLNRRPCGDKCAWTEGWMDQLAMDWVRHWLQSTNSPLWWRTGTQVTRHCEQFHQDRYTRWGAGQPTTERRRIAAQEAYDELKLILHRNKPATDVFETLTAFSIRLNALDLNRSARKPFFTDLSNQLTRAKQTDPSRSKHNAQENLRCR